MSERTLEAVKLSPKFLPDALLGTTWRRCRTTTTTWFGADEFTIYGELGAFAVPAKENWSNNVEYVHEGGVLVEVLVMPKGKDGLPDFNRSACTIRMMMLSRHEMYLVLTSGDYER